MRSHLSILGVLLALLGLILLVSEIKNGSNLPSPDLFPQNFTYEDITIKEFAILFARDFDFFIKLSDSAKGIEKKASIGAAKGFPIKKTLLLASDTWSVKLFWKSKNIFICLPAEQPPITFRSEDTELIYATPLPVVRSLKFSKAKYMCGPNCLALISYALGNPVSVEKVAELAGTNMLKGTTMSGLAQAARSLGLKVKGKKMSLGAYKKIKSPVIIHLNINNGHYAVLQSYNSDGTFSVIDCPVTRVLSEEELKKQYSGHALFVWK
jgi:hypothetical protein